MLNSFFLSAWNNPIHGCRHKSSILLPSKDELTGLVGRFAAQQQQLRSSQITCGCKRHRPAPQQPASLSTEAQQVCKRGLHPACTVLLGMRSPVELRALLMRKKKRVCGAPPEVKSGNLKYTAQLYLFFPSITLPRSIKCDTAQLHMKDLNITLKANETQIAKTSLNNFRE